MQKTLLTLALYGGLMWVACERDQGKTVDVEVVRAAIEQAQDRYLQAFNNHDVTLLTDFYSEEAIVMPPNGPAVRGREAIRAALEDLFSTGTIQLELATQRLEVLNGTAYELGSYTVNRDDAEPDQGKYVLIWQQDPSGQWKVHVDIWNSDLPVPTAEMTVN